MYDRRGVKVVRVFDVRLASACADPTLGPFVSPAHSIGNNPPAGSRAGKRRSSKNSTQTSQNRSESESIGRQVYDYTTMSFRPRSEKPGS